MDIVGYVGYAVLVILAIIWTIGVRAQLGAGTHTIVGALYFVIGAIVIPVFNVNMLHALWVIPIGFLFSGIIAPILIRIPILSFLIRLVAGIFTGAVRIGVPRQKIEEAQAASMQSSIDEGFDKEEDD